MKAIALLLGLALAGPASAQEPPIPPVAAVSVGPQGLTVRIALDGCPAAKSSLTLAVQKGERLPLVLIARRRSAAAAAACAAPGSAELTWSLEDLGLAAGQPFNLGNPLSSSTALAGEGDPKGGGGIPAH